MSSQNFCTRRNNNKVDFIEAGRTAIAHVFPKVINRISVHHSFIIIDEKNVIVTCKCNFTFSLI